MIFKWQSRIFNATFDISSSDGRNSKGLGRGIPLYLNQNKYRSSFLYGCLHNNLAALSDWALLANFSIRSSYNTWMFKNKKMVELSFESILLVARSAKKSSLSKIEHILLMLAIFLRRFKGMCNFIEL